MKIRNLLSALLLFFALLFSGTPALQAQFGSFGDIPIEITADGETRFIGGVAVAENNVVIHYGPTSIYTDYAQYNPDTRDVLLIGNVRIFRDGHLFNGDRALYNFETKLLRTSNFQGAAYPFFFQGQEVNSLGAGAYQVENATVTTSDSSKPDYRLRAKKVRIYPNSRVILYNVSLYIGETPVFWFPYVYQSLNQNEGFNLTPGYDGNWGAFLLTQYGFPLTEKLHGLFHLDLRTKRGVALGLDVEGQYGHDNQSWMRLKSYYAFDENPDTNPTANAQESVDSNRYRLSFESRTFFTENLYATTNLNKLSDSRFLRDFYPGTYRDDPQPDSSASLTYLSENYSLTGIVRGHFNRFFDTTERLPEVVLDIKRQPLFGSQIFYESETGVAQLRRRYGTIDGTQTTPYSDYKASRFDTFHQFSAPQTVGGWLSIVPRVGVRGTYYTHGAQSVIEDYEASLYEENLDLRTDAGNLYQQASGGSLFRVAVNAGVEFSFKFSKEWEQVQTRRWGLDGLRHIVQPYTNFSFLYTSHDSDEILQFDRLNPSTQLPPIDFPQFTTIDTLSNWTVWRWGVRNRWQTRRDNRTFNWLEMDSYLDINIDSPNFPGADAQIGTLSNFYNKVTWRPLPWLNFGLDSQIPLQSNGFAQFNSSVTWMATRDLRVNVSHRYLSNNPYFVNSNNLRFGAYYRISDNWGVSFREQFELTDGTLELQEYTLHRDLSSWVASLGLQVRDHNNPTQDRERVDIGILLTFTLKDLPSLNLPVGFDPSSAFKE